MIQKYSFWLFFGTALIWLLDAVTKVLATKFLTASIAVAPLLSFSLTQNPNLAFGIPFPFLVTIILSVFAVALLIYVFFQHTQKNSLPAVFAFALLLGGALGNLSERIIFGAVTDFIAFGPIPNFNLADMALTFGVLLLMAKCRKIFTQETNSQYGHA